MLKVGVFGAGHLGKFHIQQWQTIPGVELIGFYDPNETNAQYTQETFQLKRYQDPHLLINDAHILDIVTPTINHFEIAKECLLKSKHLFIEKPMTHSIAEAKELVQLVEEANVKCQIGHIERYNPAFKALEHIPLNPMFIETHRLSEFNPRGTDVSVILDLMIHDIDIVLHIVKSPVKRISASGVAVVSQSPDIANARIEFDNGCVANLTSSRISLTKMRKSRIFQKDAYISVDFLHKKTEIVRLTTTVNPVEGGITLPIEIGNDQEQKGINISYPDIDNANALQMELADFVLAIVTQSKVSVPVYDGFYAMEVAYKILEKINTSMMPDSKLS